MGVFLGPLGGLREVGEVQAGVQVASSRASSERVSLGGVRIVQRARRAPRTWSADLGRWRTPAQVAYVAACASGAIPGPLYLLTPHAAVSNMLPGQIAAPGQLGDSGLLTAAGDRPVLGTVPVAFAGQGVVPSVGVTQSASAGAWSKTIPLPQVAHTLSVWSSAAGSAVQWRTVTATGAVAQSGASLTTAAVTGGFRASTTITPSATAVGVQLALTAGSRVVGGLRLTEGAHDAAWLPGEGVPMVVVEDPSQSMQQAVPGSYRSDYTVTLKEVG